MIEWFKIEVYCQVTRNLETSEELSEVDEIRLKNEGVFIEEHEKEIACINFQIETIAQLNPRCFVPKTGLHKRWATEIVFDSGRIIFAVGRPSEVMEQINKYLESLPD